MRVGRTRSARMNDDVGPEIPRRAHCHLSPAWGADQAACAGSSMREDAVHSFDLGPDASGGFDFVVDGRLLREMVFEGQDVSQREVTLLRSGLFPGPGHDQIRRLKGELPGEFFPDRVWLYFCPACYDEGCGGISVRIQIEDHQVVWSNLRHDGVPYPEDESEVFDDEDDLSSVGPLVFDRAEYETSLDRVAELLGRSETTFWRRKTGSAQSTLGLERLVSRRQLRKRTADPKVGLQWTIDGRPLSRTLRKASRTLPELARELQTDLQYSVVQERQDNYAEAGRNAIRQLLGEGVWDERPGRVPLFVGECLDLECGVITVAVERQQDAVVWGDFRVHGAGAEEQSYPYDPQLSFTFDRQQHDEILRRILARL